MSWPEYWANVWLLGLPSDWNLRRKLLSWGSPLRCTKFGSGTTKKKQMSMLAIWPLYEWQHHLTIRILSRRVGAICQGKKWQESHWHRNGHSRGHFAIFLLHLQVLWRKLMNCDQILGYLHMPNWCFPWTYLLHTRYNAKEWSSSSFMIHCRSATAWVRAFRSLLCSASISAILEMRDGENQQKEHGTRFGKQRWVI